MLNDKQRALIAKAIELLDEADALVQEALGATDACYDTHCAIQDVIGDLGADYLEAEIG
jgi:flagellar biosynthesis regulator FlaF